MEVFRLLGTIAVKNEDANKKIKETKEKAEGLAGVFSKIGEATIKFGNTAMKGVGIIGAAWTASVEGSREYRTEMGKLNTAFMASGHTTKTAADAYRTLYSVIGQTDQAVEAAQQIALLANAEKDVAEWAGLAAGVAGRFGDALMPETFFEAANETIKLGEATGAYVQMLEGMGMSVDGFNAGLAACNTEAEKQAYMLSVTKSALGEASKAYNENNKDIIDANRAQSDLTDTMSKIGEYTEPAMTKLKEAVTAMVETALPYLKSFMEWTTEHGEATKSAIMGIATAMAVAAVAAHPYAAAVTAVAAGLMLLTNHENKVKGGEILAKYSEADLQTLQEYVDAMRAANEAEKAMIESGYDLDATERFHAANDAKDAAEARAKAVKNMMDDYYAYIKANGVGKGDDIFLDVPLRISDDSEGNVQSEISSMDLEGIVKILPDMSAVNSALSYTRYMNVQMGVSGPATGTVDGSFASGLDRVPNDGYIARLHKDEAVLNSRDATEWRAGGSGRVEALLGELVNIMRAGQVIQLDSGIMAGQLTPAIDARLGTVASRKGRGN